MSVVIGVRRCVSCWVDDRPTWYYLCGANKPCVGLARSPLLAGQSGLLKRILKSTRFYRTGKKALQNWLNRSRCPLEAVSRVGPCKNHELDRGTWAPPGEYIIEQSVLWGDCFVFSMVATYSSVRLINNNTTIVDSRLCPQCHILANTLVV